MHNKGWLLLYVKIIVLEIKFSEKTIRIRYFCIDSYIWLTSKNTKINKFNNFLKRVKKIITEVACKIISNYYKE